MATMPSSPPRRIHSRVSSLSSNSSQYSLNLDAFLPPDEHDESSLLLQQPKTNAIDVVNSEDIDGPTDFTQNMEYWMSTKLPTVVEPTKLEGAPKKDMEEYIGSDDTLSTTKHVPIKHDSPFDVPLDDAPSEPEPEEPVPEDPEPAPPSPSTPRTVVELASPPSRPVTRQATVEDYEDTPVQPRDPSEGPSATSTIPEAALTIPEATLAIPESTPGPSETEKSLEKALQMLQADLAWVRTQMEQQKHRHARQLTETKAAHESKLRRAHDAHNRQLGHKDAQIRHQDEQLEEAKREIVTLGRELEELGSDRARFFREASILQGNAARLESEKARVSEEASTLQQNHDVLHFNAIKLENALRDLEAQAEQDSNRLKNEHAQQSQRLEAELQAKAEIEAEIRQELSAVEVKHREELSTIKSRAEELLSLQGQAAAQINALIEERDALTLRLEEIEDEHRQEVSTIEAEAEETVVNAVEKHSRQEDQRSAQIAMLTKERDLLISKFKDQKDRNTKSQSEFESAIAAFEAKVKELASNNAILTEDLQKLRVKLSNTVKFAESKVNDALKENRKLSTELQATNEKLQVANEKLQLANEKSDAVNAQFDKTVKEMLRKKDKEWRGRFADLEKEKNTIGKVLMKEWGEKECGPMEPHQGYRYKYV